MGGNGTFACGNEVPYRWETVDKINGVKILKLKKGAQKLPEESHSSRMYILLDKNGNFAQLREYGPDHTAIFEIGYHRERNISENNDKILHYHVCNGLDKKENHNDACRMTREIFEQYKQYMPGVKFDE